jgi:hypothetical protein
LDARERENIARNRADKYKSPTTPTKGAPKLVLRPEVANRTATLKLLRSYLETLGLTPSSVGRIDLSAMPRPRDAARDARHERFFGDPTEEFFFGPRGAR